MKVLPPGFRFHPTDVELLKYYLKRKILGRPYFEALKEVSIYELEPSELPSLSRLKSDDQKWYFLCPRERRYGHGDRAKRSTQGGFWKTTGRDRPVMYNDEPVGMIKTLIFHQGRAPHGNRTDWVMHEYRLEDRDLAAKGIPQDTYVVCAIFKKKGLGPRNGAQYGALFKEEDWEDDEINGILPPDLLITASGSILPAPPPQEEQQGQYARNHDEANNCLSESIAVVGTPPPPVLAASEPLQSETPGAIVSSPIAIVNHANEARMDNFDKAPSGEGMDLDELLAELGTSLENDNNQKTQTAAAVTDVAARTVPTAAEGNGIFAGLPDLDEGPWSSRNGFSFDPNDHFQFQTEGYMELLDLGPPFSEFSHFSENRPGADGNTGNPGDPCPYDWRGF